MTRSGRLFQTRAAATGKARSPTVGSRVRLTINDEDELERHCCVLTVIINNKETTYLLLYVEVDVDAVTVNPPRRARAHALVTGSLR